jgi:hypothetical protein
MMIDDLLLQTSPSTTPKYNTVRLGAVWDFEYLQARRDVTIVPERPERLSLSVFRTV